jgi:hypothetical protein
MDAGSRGMQHEWTRCVPGLEVVEVPAQHWMKDPLSRTTRMTHRPGQLTRDLAGL